MRFFQLYPSSTYHAAILQAPVSDRQYHENKRPRLDLEKSLSSATAQIDAGKGDFPLPVDVLQAVRMSKTGPPDPITARRWHSLAAKGGKEDYFSSDLSDDQLAENFRPFRETGKICCNLLGDEDESYPDFVNKQELLSRFEKASGASDRGHSHSAVLMGSNHEIDSSESSMQDFVSKVTTFLQDL